MNFDPLFSKFMRYYPRDQGDRGKHALYIVSFSLNPYPLLPWIPHDPYLIIHGSGAETSISRYALRRSPASRTHSSADRGEEHLFNDHNKAWVATEVIIEGHYIPILASCFQFSNEGRYLLGNSPRGSEDISILAILLRQRLMPLYLPRIRRNPYLIFRGSRREDKHVEVFFGGGSKAIHFSSSAHPAIHPLSSARTGEKTSILKGSSELLRRGERPFPKAPTESIPHLPRIQRNPYVVYRTHRREDKHAFFDLVTDLTPPIPNARMSLPNPFLIIRANRSGDRTWMFFDHEHLLKLGLQLQYNTNGGYILIEFIYIIRRCGSDTVREAGEETSISFPPSSTNPPSPYRDFRRREQENMILHAWSDRTSKSGDKRFFLRLAFQLQCVRKGMYLLINLLSIIRAWRRVNRRKNIRKLRRV